MECVPHRLTNIMFQHDSETRSQRCNRNRSDENSVCSHHLLQVCADDLIRRLSFWLTSLWRRSLSFSVQPPTKCCEWLLAISRRVSESGVSVHESVLFYACLVIMGCSSFLSLAVYSLLFSCKCFLSAAPGGRKCRLSNTKWQWQLLSKQRGECLGSMFDLILFQTQAARL